ncbi:MAG: SPFH domain-containing protein, partial [Acidimicrobiales bacterium]
ELLARRNGLDRPLTERVAGVASEFGLAVGAVRVRDLITPGELKRAVAEVVQAKLSGQAAVERARGETAALRSLANAARAAADNPALLQLRLIQQMESSHGNTYVLGTGTPPIL